MIKNIVFDLGGVLVPLNRKACVNAFDRMGYNDFNSVINEYVQGGFFLEYEKGKISSDEFRDIIRSNIMESKREEASDYLIDLAMKQFLDPISVDKLIFLLSLKGKYKVYLLSNTNPIAINAVEPYFSYHNKEMKDYFDKLFLSYEMKLAKPQKEIFTRMLSDGNMIGDETLFIDDSPANINASQEVGINSLLYTPGENLKDTVIKFL